MEAKNMSHRLCVEDTQFMMFMARSIEYFSQSRFYCRKYLFKHIFKAGTEPTKLDTYVDICCGSNVINETIINWVESEQLCIVSFNGGGLDEMKLNAIPNWIKKATGVYCDSIFDESDNKEVFDPFKTPNFVKQHKIITYYVTFMNSFASRITNWPFRFFQNTALNSMSDEYVYDDVSSIELPPIMTKYYGIECFNQTFHFIKNRVAMLVDRNNPELLNKHLEMDEKLVDNMDMTQLLNQYKYPSDVINGYWFYNDFSDPDQHDYDKNIMYLTPNNVEVLKRFTQPGTHKFRAEFRRADNITFSINTHKTKSKIAGFIEIKAVKPTNYQLNLQQRGHCLDKLSRDGTWYCATCAGVITVLPNHFKCPNCGINKGEDVHVYNF